MDKFMAAHKGQSRLQVRIANSEKIFASEHAHHGGMEPSSTALKPYVYMGGWVGGGKKKRPSSTLPT